MRSLIVGPGVGFILLLTAFISWLFFAYKRKTRFLGIDVAAGSRDDITIGKRERREGLHWSLQRRE